MPLGTIATAAFGATGASAAIEGPAALESQFSGLRGKIVRPCSGTFNQFLRLDSPRDIDETDGVRTVAAADVSTILPPLDLGGAVTMPGDGAWFECSGITIPAGSAMEFHWGFLRFDVLPGDDFCGFEVISNAGSEFHLLSRVKHLQSRRPRPAFQTEGPDGTVWIRHQWPLDGPLQQDFTGAFRWIVANGELLEDPNDPTTDILFTFPSAMVLCGLDIV